MTNVRRSNFEKCALASGLLNASQLDEARIALRAHAGESVVSEASDPDSSDPNLSERLVQMGLLNAWQAKQLLDGRTRFTLGPYRIVDSLGQGGMGHVYKAEDQVLRRPVAIKVLPREKSTPEAIANFNRESQALGSLNHPRLVKAIDAGYDGNVYYLVVEYVPGCDLRKLVRRDGPLSLALAASIISQVAEGLHHAHQRGIVHRDVKPGNVLVTPEGEAKLSDLGLAGSMYATADDDPRYGKIVGTADYLSPDHINSPFNPTPAWDIYSLGCTLYYAVTGKVPFPGGTTSDKARAHLEMKPLDPRRLNTQLTDRFVDVIADMMAKDPAERIPTAEAVAMRLSPWLRGSPPPEISLPAPSLGPPVAPPIMATLVTPSANVPLSLTPAEPIQPPPLPGTNGGSERYALPVMPPPIVARRTSGWDADGNPAAPDLLLKDTLPDLPGENSAESQDSMSLVVETPNSISIHWLLFLVLTPLVLAGAVIALLWIRNFLR